MYSRTKKMVALAIISAMAYALMLFFRVPVVLFLKYDPKDIIITIGGFIFGPLSALTVSLVVSFIEMLTVSDTGPIGFLMNAVASGAFACTAAVIYKKWHSLKGAVAGLAAATAAMTAVMLLWNYFITPIYMGYPREAVAAMLIPVFLPFNLLKGGLNAAFTMLIYKPVVTALRQANLVPESHGENTTKLNALVVAAALLVLATCVMLVLVLNGTI